MLIDLDPQCNATSGLGHAPTAAHPLVAAAPLAPAMLPTGTAGLDLLPGTRAFRDVEALTRADEDQAARTPPATGGRGVRLRFRAH